MSDWTNIVWLAFGCFSGVAVLCAVDVAKGIIRNKTEKHKLLYDTVSKLERGLEGFTGSVFNEGIEDRLLRVENQYASVNSWRQVIEKLVSGVTAYEDELHALESDVGKVIRTVNALDSRIDSIVNRLNFVPDREIKKQG